MKVLVNTTTMFKGGGVQAATHFVLEALKDSDRHEWCLALSSKVVDEVRRFTTPPSDGLHVFDTSPARSPASRRRLRQLEAHFQADCVFTVYGPAYVEFKAPHLLGCNEPWITHSTWRAYQTLSFPIGWIGTAMTSTYKRAWIRRADAWVTEAEPARRGLHERLGIPLDKVAVVPNTCGDHYFDSQARCPFPGKGDQVRLLCFTASYTHKRIELLPYVARELVAWGTEFDFEFVITLPRDDPTLEKVLGIARSLDVAHLINNVGPVPVAEGPKMYRRCNICFLPTVLETFSATYPEAMAMGVPIVTTNLDFARAACRDAALYFEPNNAASAAKNIIRLVQDSRLWDDLIANGKDVLQSLPTSRRKYESYIHLLSTLIAKGDKYQGL